MFYVLYVYVPEASSADIFGTHAHLDEYSARSRSDSSCGVNDSNESPNNRVVTHHPESLGPPTRLESGRHASES